MDQGNWENGSRALYVELRIIWFMRRKSSKTSSSNCMSIASKLIMMSLNVETYQHICVLSGVEILCNGWRPFSKLTQRICFKAFNWCCRTVNRPTEQSHRCNIKVCGLTWPFPAPQSILTAGTTQELFHPLSNCDESQKNVIQVSQSELICKC